MENKESTSPEIIKEAAINYKRNTDPDNLVVDPFLGAGTTAVVAEQLGRKWMGCDLSVEYCQWAAERIERVEKWSVEKWIEYDLENAKRRKSIR